MPESTLAAHPALACELATRSVVCLAWRLARLLWRLECFRQYPWGPIKLNESTTKTNGHATAYTFIPVVLRTIRCSHRVLYISTK